MSLCCILYCMICILQSVLHCVSYVSYDTLSYLLYCIVLYCIVLYCIALFVLLHCIYCTVCVVCYEPCGIVGYGMYVAYSM